MCKQQSHSWSYFGSSMVTYALFALLVRTLWGLVLGYGESLAQHLRAGPFPPVITFRRPCYPFLSCLPSVLCKAHVQKAPAIRSLEVSSIHWRVRMDFSSTGHSANLKWCQVRSFKEYLRWVYVSLATGGRRANKNSPTNHVSILIHIFLGPWKYWLQQRFALTATFLNVFHFFTQT